MAISDKLTYLNDTKTQLKDMINYGLDTGEKITSETTFRNYVKSLFDAFIKTMTYPDVLYNNLPKVTGEGTSLTLNDTVYAPMRVELSPSALEQETTTGKNKIGLNDYSSNYNSTTYTSFGNCLNIKSKYGINANLVSSLSTYKITATTNYDISQMWQIVGLNPNTQYIISANISTNLTSGNMNIFSKTLAYNTTNTFTIFTTDSNGEYVFDLMFYGLGAGGTGKYIELTNIQLEIGSTVTSYEEYTGGIASPNPQYPQQIHTVSGENTIEIIGKNLIEGNTQHSYANSTNGIISIVTSSSKNQYLGFNDKAKVKPSTQYSVKFYEVSGTYSLFYTTYDSTGTYIERKSFQANDGTGAFTTGSNVYYVFCWLYSSSGPFTNDNTPIQLEKGSTATSYEPYQEQTYPLSLGDLEYCKIGDYEDSFIRTSGKNLLNPIGETLSNKGVTFTNNGDGTFTVNGTASEAVNFSLTNLTTFPITLEANKPYTQTLDIISGTFGGSIVPAFKNNGGTITYNYFNCNASSRTDTKTPTENMIAHTYNLYLGAGVSITNCTFRVQLEQNSQATPYEPYDNGKWYLKKNIGKVVLNGSEDGWVNDGGGAPYKYVISDIKNPPSNAYTEVLCDNYYPVPYNDNWNNYDYLISRPIYTSTVQGVKFRNKDISSLNNFKTWLSTHNTTVYYVLATPTYTLLSDTLQTQLEAIWRANSYQDQTNVSQTNNDLPFVISASAIRDLSGIFELIQG